MNEHEMWSDVKRARGRKKENCRSENKLEKKKNVNARDGRKSEDEVGEMI